MDFFGHQDKARSRSGWIYLLFFTFVGILGIINGLAVWYIFVFWTGTTEGAGGMSLMEISLWTVGITYAVILGGTLIEWSQFSGGGERVAEMLGGKLIPQHTHDPDEKRLLNIVEEMAIAAGMSVPKVYILEEEGVNAFAAGKKPSDSVIGVTRGALKTFNREEMQGVVAHEFSHILNGDVQKNLRLAALVFGVFCLFILGQTALRSVMYVPMRLGGSRDRGDGAAAVAAVVAALAVTGVFLCAIGLLGQFFGRILQMSHSRQREYLADASAVQFTRNPEGIGNALIKLGSESTRLKSPRSNSLNHLFFGETSLAGLLSSHPPLKERIRRVLPRWDGKLAAAKRLERPRAAAQAGQSASVAGAAVSGFAGAGNVTSRGRELAGKEVAIADLISQHLAQHTVPEVSEEVQEFCRELMSARFVVNSLLLADQPEIRERQVQALLGRLDTAGQKEFLKVAERMQRQPKRSRFPTLEHALPTLEQISEGQFQQLVREMDELIAADGRISYWEFMVRYAVQHYFERNCGYVTQSDPKPGGSLSLPVAGGIVLRILCQMDGDNEQLAWKAAVTQLGNSGAVVYPPDPFPPHWTVLKQAFNRIEHAGERVKVALINAGVAAVLSNNRVELEELEVLRLLGMVMEIPIPPLALSE